MSISLQKLGQQIWQRLTQPSDNIQHESLRLQAGLPVALLAALLLAVLVFVPIWVLANPEYPQAPYIGLALILIMIAAYGLSRTARFNVGKILGTLAIPFYVIVVILTSPSPVGTRMLTLNLLVIAILLGNIFFGARVTLLMAGLSVLGISAFFFVPDVPAMAPFSHIVTLTGTATFLIIIGTIIESSAQHLQESEARFRSLFEQSNDAVFILDLHGAPMKINRRAADMFGYTTEELTAMRYIELVDPSEREQSREVFRKITSGENLPPFERTFIKKDGTDFPAEVSVEMVHDERGNLIRIQLIVRDISERRRAEHALREREEYLRTVIANAPSGIYFFRCTEEDSLVLEDANPAAASILDIDHQTLIGKPIEEAFPGLVGTEIPANFKDIAVQGNSLHAQEMAYYDNGKGGIFEIQAFQTVPGSMAVFFVEITERKHAEQQALALAVEKERINILKQFIENAAHELRTPLAIINTKTFLVEKAPTDEARLRHTDNIRAQTARLVKLLEMMNHMVILDSDVPFVFQSVDINDLLRQAIARTGPALTEKALEVQVESDTPLLLACVDIGWFEEAIQNLIDNAVRFTPAQGSITARPYGHDENVVIEIHDTGTGISQEALPHIFERFWRADDAHSTPGFGLGLSIAQKVVEHHQGKIEVESSQGAGSLFRVIVPSGTDKCAQPMDAPS